MNSNKLIDLTDPTTSLSEEYDLLGWNDNTSAFSAAKVPQANAPSPPAVTVWESAPTIRSPGFAIDSATIW